MKRRLHALLLISAATLPCAAATAQTTVEYEDRGGIRYQITKQVVQRQIPVTQSQSQQQTYYRQQVTTETVAHQQMYAVPVTQYQLVSTLHGRWNPFVTPYWTHEYKPVTTWTQQVANVQIPVNRVAMVPETRTVQTPVTTYQTAEQTLVSSVPIGPSSSFGDAKPLVAQGTPYSGQDAPLSSAAAPSTAGSQPSATIAARPSAPPPSSTPSYNGSYNAGGTVLQSDPPRQATGWTDPLPGDRYGQRR